MPSHTPRVRDFRIPQPREIWTARGSVNHALLDAATSAGSIPLSPAMRRQYDDLRSIALSADSGGSKRVLRDGEIIHKGHRLRGRPVILESVEVEKGSWGGPITGKARAYLLTTFDGRPITQLPELARHFSVSVGDTEPWPTQDAAVIKPLPDWPMSRETPVYVIAHHIDIPLACLMFPMTYTSGNRELPYRLDPAQILLLKNITTEKNDAYKGKNRAELRAWSTSWVDNAKTLRTGRSQVSAAPKSSAKTGKTGKTGQTGQTGKTGLAHTRTISGSALLGANGPESKATTEARPANAPAQSAGGDLRAPASSLPSTAPPPPPVVASQPRVVPPRRRPLTITPPPAALPHVQPHVPPPPSPAYNGNGWPAQGNAPRMPTHPPQSWAAPLPTDHMAAPPPQYPEQVQHVVPQPHHSYGIHPAHAQAYSPTIYQHPSQPIPVMHAPGVYAQLAPAAPSPTAAAHFQQYQHQHQHQQYHNGQPSPLAHSTFPDPQYAYAGHAQDAYDPGHNQYQYQQQQQHQYQHQQHPSYSGVHEADHAFAAAQAHASYMQQQQHAAAYNPAPGHNQYPHAQAQPHLQPQHYYPGMHDVANVPYVQPAFEVSAGMHAPEYVHVAAG